MPRHWRRPLRAGSVRGQPQVGAEERVAQPTEEPSAIRRARGDHGQGRARDAGRRRHGPLCQADPARVPKELRAGARRGERYENIPGELLRGPAPMARARLYEPWRSPRPAEHGLQVGRGQSDSLWIQSRGASVNHSTGSRNFCPSHSLAHWILLTFVRLPDGPMVRWRSSLRSTSRWKFRYVSALCFVCRWLSLGGVGCRWLASSVGVVCLHVSTSHPYRTYISHTSHTYPTRRCSR